MNDLLSLKRRYGIIGNSDAYNRALDRAVQVASSDLTVIITGESGVGKEVFSKIIHQQGARKHNNFIAINCGAIPEGTIDSELFGHEKGAFTGASEKRTGYFEYADGGTIFLDEVGEMPASTQARLLRILESGEFMKVGSSKVQKTNVRVIAATNVDLAQAIQKGKFREDLFYRLNTVPIYVPPLRERQEDVYLLFRKFTVDFAERQKSQPISLTEDAQALLRNYRWPGNIRELKNLAEQMSVLASDSKVDAEELMSFLPNGGQTNRNLPALANMKETDGDSGMGMSEREIMYKLLFDMRNDINDLKQFIWQLAQNGQVSTADLAQSNIFREGIRPTESPMQATRRVDTGEEVIAPIVLSARPGGSNYIEEENAEVIEESLSIADKEKELILTALKKHKGKRKYAAAALGISERTLYRKIKEYNINE